MKILFELTEDCEIPSSSEENRSERIPNVRLSMNENDLIERRPYDFATFMGILKSKKIKNLGYDSKF